MGAFQEQAVLCATMVRHSVGRRLQNWEFTPSDVGTIPSGGAVGIGLAFLVILGVIAALVLMRSNTPSAPGSAPKPVVAGAGCFRALGFNLAARRNFYWIMCVLSVIGAAFFAAGAGSLWYGSTFIFQGVAGAFGLANIKVCVPSMCRTESSQNATLIAALVIVAIAGLFSLIRAAALAAAAGNAMVSGRPASCLASDGTVFALSITTMVIGIVGGAIPPIYMATQLTLDEYKTLYSLAGPGLVSIGVTYSTITAIVAFVLWRFVPIAGGNASAPYAGNGSIISVPAGAAAPGVAVVAVPVATAVAVPLYAAPGQAAAVAPAAEAAPYAASLPLDPKIAPATVAPAAAV